MTFQRMVACVVVLGAQTGNVQSPARSYDFRLWRIDREGSRHAVGSMCGGGSANADLRIWIRPSRRLPGPTPYRLEADLVVHGMGDSTLLIGDITAARAESGGSGRVFVDSVIRTRVNEEVYRRSIVLRRGEAAWFYPFGQPVPGEDGVVLEIVRSPGPQCVIRADSLVARTRRRGLAVEGIFGNYGITVAERLHRADVRVEVGDAVRGWRRVFEGTALTRVPLRIGLGADGARGQELMLELEAPEWGVPEDLQESLCWRWFWADREPPGGGACASISRGTSVQRLYGSTAGHLRVTVLSAS